MIGRLVGAAAMNYVAPTKYLSLNALIAIIMIIVSMNSSGSLAMWYPQSCKTQGTKKEGEHKTLTRET